LARNLKSTSKSQVFSKDLPPSCLSFISPKSKDLCHVGIVGPGKRSAEFADLLRQFTDESPISSKQLGEYSILSVIGGGVELSGPRKPFVVGNTLFIGDTRAHNNPYSGEGIIPGILMGQAAAESAYKAIRSRDISLLSEFEEAGMSYMRRVLPGIDDVADVFKFEDALMESDELTLKQKRLLKVLSAAEMIGGPEDVERILTAGKNELPLLKRMMKEKGVNGVISRHR